MSIFKLIRILRAASSISNFELPLLFIGILAAIPGTLDESLVGVGLIVLYAVVAASRGYFKGNRDAMLKKIEFEHQSGNISTEEYEQALRAINILTVSGTK